MQNLCGLRVHIKFIFWVSQQQWFGKSHGATGFLNMESVHQYLHWRKISEETKRDNYLSLSIAICPCLSFTQWLTQVSISPFVCLPNQLVYKSVHFCFTGWRVCWKTKKNNNISHHLTGNPNHSQERINHFLDLAPSDCSGRRSWQLIASGLSIILPPSSESWLVQEQESAVRLCNWERQISKNQRTACASPCLVFWFFTVCQVQLYCV